MELHTLFAISPIDGRYHEQVRHFDNYFSEYALMKYRLKIEVEYLTLLADKNFFTLPTQIKKYLNKIVENFSAEDAREIKHIESNTRHDVKAVEYFIKSKLDDAGFPQIKEWVHFGLTSQDINNTAIPLLWKHAMEQELLPAIINIKNKLYKLALQWEEEPMLSRTHGQPASPTTVGKEWMVFVERLDNQIQLFSYIPYAAKFGGATGNFNAHHAAFPKTDWIGFANYFVNDILGLQRMQFTTQIEHYDHLAAHFDCLKRINNIFIDLCRDMWSYISMDYYTQKTVRGEIGSSAMPHKVNPIDFENGEGNLGMANALFEYLSAKLPISRLQRDLTDSTVLRNIGVPVAHTIVAMQSLEKGLNKLILNTSKIRADLNNNWAVIAEAIQTILRREKYPSPYEALKELTRGKANITREHIHQFIDGLKINATVKKELKKITPMNYTGVQPKI